MSFGFSVGDFIAVGGVIADICNCLRDAGGSKRECQELERELQCLQKALVHLDSLNASNPSATLDSIRYAAISCRRPLEEFLSKIRKYDETLGPSTTTSSIQGGFSKIRFRFGPSKDAIKLQNYLVVHIGTINILLAQYGLETLTISCQRTEGHQDEIQRRLDSTQAWLARIQGGMSTQVSVIFRNLSLLERLYSMVNGEIKSTINSLKDAVMRACVSTQQIFAVVVEIRASINTRIDTRWSFFQDPIICEDALGRKFPVPSEYDYDLLDSIIWHKFQAEPGFSQVQLGNYEILDGFDRTLALSSKQPLRPGSSIVMVALISKPPPEDGADKCPMPRCGTRSTVVAPAGGRQCSSCGVWFAETPKTRRSPFDLWTGLAVEEDDNVLQTDSIEQSRPQQQRRLSEADDTVAGEAGQLNMLKNVRLTEPTRSLPPLLNQRFREMYLGISRMMIEVAVDCMVADDWDRTPVAAAAVEAHMKTVLQLLENFEKDKSRYSYIGSILMLIAACRGSAFALQQLIEGNNC